VINEIHCNGGAGVVPLKSSTHPPTRPTFAGAERRTSRWPEEQSRTASHDPGKEPFGILASLQYSVFARAIQRQLDDGGETSRWNGLSRS
jgi:hypothetical protein